MFAPVHDADHRRSSGRGDLDEVQVVLGRVVARDLDRYDAELFSVRPDQADGADPDLLVDSGACDDDLRLRVNRLAGRTRSDRCKDLSGVYRR